MKKNESNTYIFHLREKYIVIYVSYILILTSIIFFMLPTYFGVIYDTRHFGDTLFIMGSGWRSHNDLVPALDYGHFYGGFVTDLVAIAITAVGYHANAFDIALILIASGALAGCFVVSQRRMGREAVGLLCVTVVVLLLTRHPLESGEAVTRLVSTHAFSYNRVGLACCLLCIVYAGLPIAGQSWEILAGCVVGAVLAVAALTKPTFIVLAPAVLLALLVQGRWVAFVVTVGACLLVLNLLDPGAERIFAAFAYAQASVGTRDDAQVTALIRKAIQILLAQPVALTMVIAAALVVLCRAAWLWRQVMAVTLVSGGGIGMATTMGGGGVLGQLALPILLVGVLVMAELLHRHGQTRAIPLRVMGMVLCVSFVVPHLANLLGVTLEAYARQDQVRILDGPYAGYLHALEANDAVPGRASQYEMFVEGIEALKTLGRQAERGIIADNGITFEFALLAKPVPGFPLWPRPHLPEFADGVSLPPETDLILLGHGTQVDPIIGPVIRSKLTDAFVLCKRTRYWEIIARRNTAPEPCSSR